jgi:hypothetical protein
MKKILIMMILFVFLLGCAWIPARPALQENISASPGKIEGNQFTGIRYSFNVSVPPHWILTTEFPDFLEEMGYDRPFSTDKEQTELYAYNPETKSNINFDFTPAGRYFRTNQKRIESLTASVTGNITSELEKERGKGVANIEVAPTEPISFKGGQYAAKKYVTYTYKGLKREQGWIYGFTEPYQFFILYSLLEKENAKSEKEGANDRQDLKKILDSFEFIKKKK